MSKFSNLNCNIIPFPGNRLFSNLDYQINHLQRTISNRIKPCDSSYTSKAWSVINLGQAEYV